MSTESMSLAANAAVSGDIRTLDDGVLVSMAKRGDTDAFGVLVDRHQRYVFNVALRMVRDANVAEDMAQEAFFKAFRLLGSFRGDSAFSTWLYRVTVNVCLSELGKKTRGRETALPAELEDTAAERGHDAEGADTAEALRRCVTKLPDRYRRIITLYYLKETAYEEIAGLMKVPMGTLKTWMHRARHELKRIVEKEFSSHGAR